MDLPPFKKIREFILSLIRGQNQNAEHSLSETSPHISMIYQSKCFLKKCFEQAMLKYLGHMREEYCPV